MFWVFNSVISARNLQYFGIGDWGLDMAIGDCDDIEVTSNQAHHFSMIFMLLRVSRSGPGLRVRDKKRRRN